MIYIADARYAVEMTCLALNWTCSIQDGPGIHQITFWISAVPRPGFEHIVKVTRMKDPSPDDYYWLIERDNGYESRCINDVCQIVTCIIGAVTSTVVVSTMMMEGYLAAS